MATTKYTLAEQAMRILSGGHLKPDRNLDVREVMMYIDQCRDTLIATDFSENLKNNNEYDIDSGYLSYFTAVAVATDAVTGLKYSTMPIDRISLPKDMGLYSVSAPAINDAPYIPMKQGQLWQFKNSGVFNIVGNTYYYPVGEKIYYKNLPALVTAVLVIMAATSKSLTEDEPYPVPPEQEKVLVDMAIERFGVAKQIPHDEIEDGNK